MHHFSSKHNRQEQVGQSSTVRLACTFFGRCCWAIKTWHDWTNLSLADVCVSLCEVVCFLSSCFCVLSLRDLPESFLWNGWWQAEACAFLMALHLSRPESNPPTPPPPSLAEGSGALRTFMSTAETLMAPACVSVNVLWIFYECLMNVYLLSGTSRG